MFSRDFTNYYTYPNEKNQNEYQILGRYYQSDASKGPVSSPARYFTAYWPEAELTPEKLIGGTHTLEELSNAPTSDLTRTYKVVRAVAEAECVGYADCVNAWDNSLVSLGPCHWTLGDATVGGNIFGKAELGSFLSYLHTHNRDDYMQAYGNFGLLPSVSWGANGSNQLVADQGKYNSWIRCHADTVTAANAPNLVPAVLTGAASNVPAIPLVNNNKVETYYYKSWHWFFRWAMAGRTIEGVRLAMWDMARMRIRAILNANIQFNTQYVRNGNTFTAHINHRLGDLITSEKGVALVYRWHVWRPGHVFGLNGATPNLRNALRDKINTSTANVNWGDPPADWTNDHERELVAAILARTVAIQTNNGQNPEQDTFTPVANWPGAVNTRGVWIVRGQLDAMSTNRNSFTLF